MKRNRSIFLFTFCLSALISCGGGSSSSPGVGETDFASITVEGMGTQLYTEATNTNADSGYSPYLTSTVIGATETYLFSLDWNGSGWDTRFQIHIQGTGPGTYNIADIGNIVLFAPEGGPQYSAMSTIASTSGAITISEFGGPLGKVKGTFDVISSLLYSLTTQTAHLTGSFSITRGN